MKIDIEYTRGLYGLLEKSQDQGQINRINELIEKELNPEIVREILPEQPFGNPEELDVVSHETHVRETQPDLSRTDETQTKPLTPEPSFPPVGTKLRFTRREFNGTDEVIGAIVTVVSVDEDEFSTTHSKGKSYSPWYFDEDWRDGLEVVTEPTSKAGELDPEESAARAALEDGWLWWGRGPLKEAHEKYSPDLSAWGRSKWEVNNMFRGDNKNTFYAILAGSELAKANGLESSTP